jgi:large conductance mechanosensitive channel
MPLIGTLLGGVDFASLSANIGDATIAFGLFIQNIVDFLIIALCIFLFIKALDKFKKKEKPAAPPAPSKEEVLLGEIRDLLKEKK